MPVQHIQSTQEFQQLLANNPPNKLIVVDFFATWCGPCRVIAPKFEELSSANSHITFVKVDTDRLQQVAQQCGIRAMPTFQFYKGSQKVDEFAGANVAKLNELVRKHGQENGDGSTDAGTSGAAADAAGSKSNNNDLNSSIDKKQMVCLNQNVKMSWQNLFDDKADTYLESDVDEQLLLEIPFNQTVKIQALKFEASDLDYAPKKVRLFINRNSVGFDEIESLNPVQELVLTPENLKGEPIQLRYVLFQRVTTLVIFIESNQGDNDVTRLNKLSIIGTQGFSADMSNIKAAAQPENS